MKQIQLPIEQQLEQLREPYRNELPEFIRSRMDQTYHIIEDMLPLRNRRRRASRWLRRMLISTAGVAGLGVVLIFSGLASPAIAQTLKQIPLMNSVFKLVGDLGLQSAEDKGMLTSVNQRVTHKDVTLSISELIYDGSRLSIVLSREDKEGTTDTFFQKWNKQRMQGTRGNSIDFYMQDKQINTSMGLQPGGEHAPDSIIVTALDSADLELPDSFEMKMVVYLADVDQKYEFRFPIKKDTARNIILRTAEKKMHDSINMSIDRVEMTPITTRLLVGVHGVSGDEDYHSMLKAIPDKYKVDDFLNLEFDIEDEQGNLQNAIAGNASGEGKGMIFSTSYEPFKAKPKLIVIKPFIRKGSDKNYIPELEFRIPVK
ncbi:DUF4179 domain-containing protein [Paenibacillus alvei]|uniref:DUF4179 domain-containing protein n=1 Tax=Paenibacillus alvei TaxID=44250 RepID=A0AAP6ZU20_PAEAL|nr:DUF4179 domain-containing protein [Paenibacillus alvei]MBG9735652.1 hypothetical protein [Paenibacillus alvei]MBG9746618.1 hypothetical protein [Paenibacillus alvei]MCY9578382.1 DUF4179 domain-containing protein [Paenibacillus alvei]MCY9584703.1 DUF4179 domain-containing protein [Paenibacillus alvei]NOJ70230.1 DUF4179 domain-containing protein [Paenibacillus alvei]